MTDTVQPVAESVEQRGKCTRGVKCLLIHILVSSVLLCVLLVLYAAHVLLVHHRTPGASAAEGERAAVVAAPPDAQHAVGCVFVAGGRARVLCSSVLVRARWSLAPANCVAARADPDLSNMLPRWRIRYTHHTYQETDIKRGLVHSFFNKDDFDNNIGLFQHLDQINLPPLERKYSEEEVKLPACEELPAPSRISNKVVSDLLAAADQDLELFGWSGVDVTYNNKARVLNSQKCSEFVTPIVDAPRAAEACAQQYVGDAEAEESAGGAVVLAEAGLVALVSWGDRGGHTPQVLLLVAPYRSWIQDMIELHI